jgi:hypothetical protein
LSPVGIPTAPLTEIGGVLITLIKRIWHVFCDE